MVVYRKYFDLPYWPKVRILSKKLAGAGDWVVLPYFTPDLGGLELLQCDRAMLPYAGTAQLRFRYGRMERQLGASILGADAIDILAAWDPSTGTLGGVYDLQDNDIRIQMAPGGPEVTASNAAWRTVWVGRCIYQEDVGWPGANEPSGERIYYCTDALAQTKDWMLNRHGLEVNGSSYISTGHPGYNVDFGGRVRGNHGASQFTFRGQNVDNHAPPGTATSDAWSDAEVLTHALLIARGDDDPVIGVSGATDLFAGSNPWPVHDGMTVFELLASVCDRRRGKGAAFLDWDDDSADPTADLSYYLRIRAQTYSDITYTNPVTSGSVTVNGASTNGSVFTWRGSETTWDVIGDHAVIDSSWRVGDRGQNVVGYLETVGEPIEVAVTLGGSDSDSTIDTRWDTGATETTFNAASATERQRPQYWPLYHYYGLKPDWDGQAKNGNGGTAARVDYRCDDDGAIQIPSGDADTSPLVIEMLPDLPFFQEYDYSSDPAVRDDGQSEIRQPERMAPIALVRTASDTYANPFLASGGASFRIGRDNDLEIFAPSDEAGTRYIGDTAESNLSSTYDHTALVVTVGLRLPHRIRMASGTPEASRQKRIHIPGLALRLASPSAIWRHDPDDGSVERGALGSSSTPAVLHDDRATLALYHSLAWEWYGTRRTPIQIALKDCVFLGTYEATVKETTGLPPDDTDAETLNFPGIGEVIDKIQADGRVHTVRTPVSRITYDHETGVSTITTDWQELDFG